MGQPDLEVGEQRHVGAHPGDLVQLHRHPQQIFLEHPGPGQHVPPGAHHQRAARKRLAALESDQLRQRDVDPVLPRNGLDGPLPAEQAGRPLLAALIGREPAGRAGAHHDQQLRPIQRRDGGHQGVPGILADDHRRPAPASVEGPHRPSRLDEALFVEDTVSRQKHLAVHVPDPSISAAQRRHQGGIVEPGPPQLEEAHHDLEGRCARLRVQRGEIGVERVGTEGQLPHRPLDEIPGERRFRENEQIGRLGIAGQGDEHLTQAGEVLTIGPFGGLELSDGQPEHG